MRGAVIRENARRIGLSQADRTKNSADQRNQELYEDRKETQARLERLKRPIALAKALYAVLDPSQKALADAQSGGIRRHHDPVLDTQ
jgi:hypothetical protein